MDFCKAKINVFREATAFAKALMSAKLLLSVCYVFGGCTQFYNACVSAYTETNIAKYVLP